MYPYASCPVCGAALPAPERVTEFRTANDELTSRATCPSCERALAKAEPPSLQDLARKNASSEGAVPRGGEDDEVMSLTGDLFAGDLMRSPLASLAPSAYDIEPEKPRVAAAFIDAAKRAQGSARTSTRARRAAGIAAGCALLGSVGLLAGKSRMFGLGEKGMGHAGMMALGRVEPWVPVVVDPQSAMPSPVPVPVPVPEPVPVSEPVPVQHAVVAVAAGPSLVAAAPAEPSEAPVEKAVSGKEVESKPAVPSANTPAHDQAEPPKELPAFDRDAAATAMARGAAAASACRQDENDHGRTRVAVTFAASGRVTTAVLEPGSIFLGTPIAGCIVAHMRDVQVPAFDGEKVTVHTSVTIE